MAYTRVASHPATTLGVTSLEGSGPEVADQPGARAPTLRIALVSETFPPEINGVAMTIGRMLDGLLRRGHRVHLARPRQHRDERAISGVEFEELLVSGVPLPGYRGLRMGLPARRRLAAIWRRWRPDLVHVVTEGPLGWSALAAAQQLRLPATTDFHTNFHAYSAHYGFGLLERAIAGYLRRFHNRSLCTFVPTRQLRGELAADGYQGLAVVARGVDTVLFTPARRSAQLRRQWGVSETDPVALYVGRIAPEKNLPLLLSAFSAMRRRRRNARLVLVGDGPARKSLETAHPEHVFAGMRAGEDLATHYASGDLFLFPSVTETFGNVTVEAMASGLAVLAHDYAAAREHIVHGENGWLVPFGDRAAFERLAAELVTDSAGAGALRRNARLTAERLGWDQVIDAFAAALMQCRQEQRPDGSAGLVAPCSE
jgi:glycosyltransferase involved in cell wall biosynthesis